MTSDGVVVAPSTTTTSAHAIVLVLSPSCRGTRVAHGPCPWGGAHPPARRPVHHVARRTHQHRLQDESRRRGAGRGARRIEGARPSVRRRLPRRASSAPPQAARAWYTSAGPLAIAAFRVAGLAFSPISSPKCSVKWHGITVVTERFIRRAHRHGIAVHVVDDRRRRGDGAPPRSRRRRHHHGPSGGSARGARAARVSGSSAEHADRAGREDRRPDHRHDRSRSDVHQPTIGRSEHGNGDATAVGAGEEPERRAEAWPRPPPATTAEVASNGITGHHRSAIASGPSARGRAGRLVGRCRSCCAAHRRCAPR